MVVYRDKDIDDDDADGGTQATRVHVPPPLKTLLNSSTPILFLQARRSPSGHVRLIVVDVVSEGETRVSIRAQAYALAGWFPGSELKAVGRPDFDDILAADNEVLEIFGGQPDPADASHFSIPYQIKYNRFKGSIEGWLDDEDNVTIFAGDQRR